MIEITSPSRLHLTLIDLNAEIGRVDGGVGITLSHPNIRITAKRSDVVEIIGESHLKERMEAAAGLMLGEGEGIRINIEEDMASHVGLGSGTQAALLAAAAVNEIYETGLSVRDLAIKVGRGGTSGIGVASFESGGFILDGGHRFSDKGSFSPSAASRADPAPVLFRHDLPDWNIVLAIPDIKGAHDSQEVDIFKKECPIPLQEVQEVSHVILMQMLPAILEDDIDSFGKAVDHLQNVGFKKREVDLQPRAVRDIMELMLDGGSHGAGMSSFGPAVYGFTDSGADAKHICRDVQKMLDDSIGGKAIVTSANNSGAIIREV